MIRKCSRCNGRLIREHGGILDPAPELVCFRCGNIEYTQETLESSREAAMQLEIPPGKVRPRRAPTSNGVPL